MRIASQDCCTKSTISGLINVYKEPGPSSFAVVQAVRKLFGADKAGHLGTLDPAAEGVIPICLGRGTKLMQFMVNLQKTYSGIMHLGVITDTQDADGEVLETRDASGVREEDLRPVFAQFVGPQRQIPPMFSAKKKNGVPLYKLARNGITIDREAASITVYSLDFIKKEGNRVHFRVHCSSGTYIRSLCHDMGLKVGCGAHLEKLVRERVGRYSIENARTLDQLQRLHHSGNLPEVVETLEQALSFLPELGVRDDRIPAVANGAAITKSALRALPDRVEAGMKFRVHDGENRLLAIVEPVADRERIGQFGDNEVAFKINRVFLQDR